MIAVALATLACVTPAHPVTVAFSTHRWPHIADHIADVRDRYPHRLHIDRAHADQHRRESLKGIPTRKGFDRDEYAPAIAREGGDGRQGSYTGRRAHVRYVPSSENRSAGAYMGRRLARYCDGSPFRMVAH